MTTHLNHTKDGEESPSDAGFWTSNSVRSFGNLSTRIGMDLDHECKYIYIRRHRSGEGGFSSIVKFNAIFLGEVRKFLEKELLEVTKAKPGELIPSLAKYPRLAMMGDKAEDFYDEKIVKSFGDFRVRTSYDESNGLYKFYLNLEKTYHKKKEWKGPVVIVNRGELRAIIQLLGELQNEL